MQVQWWWLAYWVKYSIYRIRWWDFWRQFSLVFLEYFMWVVLGVNLTISLKCFSLNLKKIQAAATTPAMLYRARTIDMFVSVRALTLKSIISVFVDSTELGLSFHVTDPQLPRKKLCNVFRTDIFHHRNNRGVCKIRFRVLVQFNLPIYTRLTAECLLYLHSILFGNCGSYVCVS